MSSAEPSWSSGMKRPAHNRASARQQRPAVGVLRARVQDMLDISSSSTIAQANAVFTRSAFLTQPVRGVVDVASMPSMRMILSSCVVVGGLACLVGLAGCASVPPLPPKALELNRDGAAALAAGDLATAEARLALAIEYNPRFTEAWVNLGFVELRRGNLDRAQQDFGKARDLNPDLPRRSTRSACSRIGRGDGKARGEALPRGAQGRPRLRRVAREPRAASLPARRVRRRARAVPPPHAGRAGRARGLPRARRVPAPARSRGRGRRRHRRARDVASATRRSC